MVKLAANFYFPSADSLNVPTNFQDINTTLPHLWNVAVELAAVIFIVLLLVGGIQYLANAGNEDAAKKSMKLILDAVIGLVLVLIAWPAGLFVLNLLGQGGQFEGASTVNDMGIGTGSEGIGGTNGGTQGKTSDTASSEGFQTVGVQIKDKQDNPVVSKEIELEAVNVTQKQDSPSTISGSTNSTGTSDNQGKVIFRDIQPGTYLIKVDGVVLKEVTVSKQIQVAEAANAEIQWINVESQAKGRQVIVSVRDKQTQQPVSNFSFKVWQRELISEPTDLLIDGVTDANGHMTIYAPENEIVFATTTQSSEHELGEYQVPAQDGTAWTIFISQESVVSFSFEVINQNGFPVVDRSAVVKDNQRIIAIGQTNQYGRITVSGKPGSALWLSVNGNQLCQTTLPPQNAQVKQCTLATINEDASQ